MRIVLRLAAAANLNIHDELNRVQRLAHKVLENMVQGVVVVDDEKVVREINPAAARLLGPKPGEMAGITARRVAELPAAGPELDELVEEAAGRDEPVWDRNLTIERDGLLIRLRANAQAIKEPDGRLGGCILLLRDLTRSLLVEERMRRMERIAGLGDAATGLVHEIKNPLTAHVDPHPAPRGADGRARRAGGDRRADRRAQGRGRPAQ